MRRRRFFEMRAECRNEGPGVFIGGSGAFHLLHKRLCVSDLTRPGQDILIRSVDLSGSRRCGDTQLVIRCPELRLRCCLGNLPHDLPEDRVFRSERNRSLDLDFEGRGFSRSVMSSDDYVIEVHALRGTLHLDPVDDRSRQAAG